MKHPETPANELERLAALWALQILDTNPEEDFDRVTRLAKRIFAVDFAFITLIDEERQWFKSVQGMEISETPRNISFCGHAILDDETMIVPNTLQDARFIDNPMVTGEPHLRFYAGQPLVIGDNLRVGTLCIADRSPREFAKDDIQLLKDLASMVEQKLTALHMATVDELTGLFNRRGFEILANHTLSLCKRSSMHATLFIMDLDKFKKINDHYGHAEGDRALKGFAGVMRDVFRESDVIARLSGDEFAALLTGTSKEGPDAMLDRLEKKLDAYNHQEQRGYALRFSVGYVNFDPLSPDGLDDLIEQGDELMYRNKQKKANPTF